MATIPFQPELAAAPLDSVRVVSEVYSVSLLATAPIVVAVLAALLLRRSPAGIRALVWRSAIVALLAIALAQLLPAQWVAWVIPQGFAEPLIELGRLRVAAGAVAPGLVPQSIGTAEPDALLVLRILGAVYWAGVAIVLVSLARGWALAHGLRLRAEPVVDPKLLRLRDECASKLGVARVRIGITDATRVPVAVGIVAPFVILPAHVRQWPVEHQRAALLHEMAHVRSRDVAFRVAAQLACAVLWFHPCAWWIARRLREQCELACDDRVLVSGVRPSDYGDLLLRVADQASAVGSTRLALALIGRDGIRERFAALAERGRDRRAPGVRCSSLTLAAASALALLLGLVELAPTHGVLHGLMRDPRWESRAVAVLGLAPRADSVAVARVAAATDPDPNVRAWASYALGSEPRDRRSPASTQPTTD